MEPLQFTTLSSGTGNIQLVEDPGDSLLAGDIIAVHVYNSEDRYGRDDIYEAQWEIMDGCVYLGGGVLTRGTTVRSSRDNLPIDFFDGLKTVQIDLSIIQLIRNTANSSQVSDGDWFLGSNGVWQQVVGGGGGAEDFLDLDDTPATYAGQGGKAVTVKGDATGLEFSDRFFPTIVTPANNDILVYDADQSRWENHPAGNGISFVGHGPTIGAGPTVTVNTTGVHVNTNLELTTLSTTGNVSVGDTASVGANVVANTTSIRIGAAVNVVVNSTAVALSNSTVTFVVGRPTAAQVTAGNWFLGANGIWQEYDPPDAPTVPEELSDLIDVELTDETNNDILVYNQATTDWENHPTGNGINWVGHSPSIQSGSTLTVNTTGVHVNADLDLTSLDVGANVAANTTVLRVGATVNVIVNSTSVALSNSTVTFVITRPTADEVTAGNWFLGANGIWQEYDPPSIAGLQTEAGLSANVAQLTSNNATNFAGQGQSYYANVSAPVFSVSANVGSNVSLGTVDLKIGNSTVNAVVNSTMIGLANSTAAFVITLPTAAQISNGAYYLGANGTWQLPDGSALTGVYKPGDTDVAVEDGGTGRSSHTVYAVLCGGTTTTGAQQSIASVGTAGQLMASAGAGALPAFNDRIGTGGSIIDNVTATISGDEITITSTAPIVSITVDTEGGAASDNLQDINGVIVGQIIFINTTTNARDVVIKHNTGGGNLRTTSSGDVTLGTVNNLIMFRVRTVSSVQEVTNS